MKNVHVRRAAAALMGPALALGAAGGQVGTAAAGAESPSAVVTAKVTGSLVEGRRTVVKAKVTRSPRSAVEGRMVLTAVGAKGAAAKREVEVRKRRQVDEKGRARFVVRFPQPGRYLFAVEFTSSPGTDEVYATDNGAFRIARR
ncbi:hypothetical protein [Nocardioides sp.]|uniref:hypothetical protein n=1 Tax=Nocardioides sp. TaxID=35761 RepID=UPI002B27B0AD|nr:hypothetical protein [Nocardioides sp.]